ncbi:(2Fe-2S)-binding protein [Mycoplasmatota bacterium]|nr:(2Fe-2S)-binding protein [Mycoplasmatota bacterium]
MKNTIICRCADITLEDINNLLSSGVTEIEEIKRFTRLGMGPCQGRTCMQLIQRIVANHNGVSIDQIKMHTSRPPVTGVKLNQISRGARNDNES